MKGKAALVIFFLCLFAILLIPFTLLCGELCAADDFQSWNRAQLKLIDTKYVDYVTYGDMRFMQDGGSLGLWQTSQKLQYDFFKYLGLGTNYTYLESETANSGRTTNEFKYQHRLELEATPRWAWKDKIKLRNRNRIEFRWIEGRGSDNTRYRGMAEVEFPIKWTRAAFLKSIFFNDELFVDFARRTISETRVIPAGLTLGAYKGIDLKLFYMIQCQSGTTWSSNQILGTHISVDF